DISKKKYDQELITHLAYHDSLTELPNRRYFNDHLTFQLNNARQSNRTLAMMYVDVDHFKYINDSLGHIIGDRMLKEIAARLVECVRNGGFVARVGGDEFNILLPDIDRKNASLIGENILEVYKKPFNIDNYELFITTSIGISIFPYDGEDAQALMRNADAALYRAKEQGKNSYKVFHSGMNIQSYKTFIMQNDLRKAIEREELALVYQPRIDIETGVLSSAEALLRWHHPSWGTIAPKEFIPLAEDSGQIVEIGEWVLRSVCRQNKAWQEAGFLPIPISINFSPQQFLQKDLVDRMKQILTETNFRPMLLEIEITESAILSNKEIITNSLNQFRKMGIGISIDDFGTGYSSLSHLMRIPVDTLKIDRSFVQDIANDSSNSQMLISTIISVAHILRMSVVAKGVETEEQLNILRKYKCQEVQGFLFSPPVSPAEFETFLINRHSMSHNRNGIIYLNDKKVKVRAAIQAGDDGNESSEADPSQKILTAALNRTKKLYSISSREMDVFKLLVNGMSNKEISDELFISEHTVKNHITHIFQKLAVSDRLQAMAKVYQTCIAEGDNLRVK
ncbi:MAG TPA: EAL domain-containing protein, partial [Neobacillus sp.]